MDYLVATSGGNDSIALKQWMYEQGKNFGCVYNDTGWARDDWSARIKRVSDWCFERGIPFYITKSEGMIALVKRKKGWPMPASAMQFCTGELKEKPTLELLERIDPDGDLIIVTGRRREESQNRANLAMHQEDSAKHGGRDVYNPLVNHDAAMRDELIIAAGFEVLPHQSMECFPCVCANSDDIDAMPDDAPVFDIIEDAEIEMGHTSNGKPRTMIRPYRAGGAIGIKEVKKWSAVRGWKADHVPVKYQIKGVDYSTYRGNFTSEERAVFWLDIKNQCLTLGYNMKELKSDLAYDEDTKAGREFARQCDGGYCGN